MRARAPEAVVLVKELLRDLSTDGFRCVILHEPSDSLQEHDIDLGIDRPFEEAWPTIVRSAARRGFVPVWRAEYDVGGATYAVFTRTVGPRIERLALDVLTDLDGIGKFGIPIRALLQARSTRDGVPYPAPAWEATYLVAKQVWKGNWTSTALDRAARLASEDTEAFASAARVVFGRPRSTELATRASSGGLVGSPHEARRLLRMIWVRRGIRCPWLPILFASRILRRASDPTGLYVTVCGPDGAGKSALTSALLDGLGPLYRKRSRMHWRPGLLPRLGAALGRRAPDARNPQGPDPYGHVLSILRFGYYWADHLLGYWAKIWPLRLRSGLVVLERGFHDMLVDPLRYRLPTATRLMNAAERPIPKPDVTIILVGAPSMLHARTPELAVDEIERQVERWKADAPRIPRAHIIDASRPFPEVAARAVSIVLGASHDSIDRRRSEDPLPG